MSAVIANPTIWTIRELLSWTTTYLGSKGIDSPRLDTQIMLAHVLKCPRIELIARSADEPTAVERNSFRELVRRRVDGWPVAYLTGQKEFYLLPFHVSPVVLVPRPDTEAIVLEAITFLKAKPSATILELGTGSGCIAIAIAANCPATKVIAIEISPDAAEVARRNAKTNGVADRVTVIGGDLYSPLTNGTTFDLIVSNPPYIATAEIETLSPDVKDHEPRLALDGGPDGLSFYRRIISDAGTWLKAGGKLMLEIGEGQSVDVLRLLPNELWTTATKKDGAGRIRVIVAQKIEKAG